MIVPAVKLKFEAPLLERLSVWAADTPLPTCWLKLKLDGDSVIVGLPVTTKVTWMYCEAAFPLFSVMVPVCVPGPGKLLVSATAIDVGVVASNGLTVSQLIPLVVDALAEKLTAAPLEDDTVTACCWLAELTLLSYLNVNAEVPTTSWVVPTLKVTGIVKT